jgi:demethylmenaquinone methyltransferase/2-methoxy-6-polyprenyl-1,4-benzoquinol methylase
MFASIVDSYDLNNRLHSLGLDQYWRRSAARLTRVRPSDVVLDVACGTGDLTGAFLRCGPERVMGVDFCPPMLEKARGKFRRTVSGGRHLLWAAADAMGLPIAAGSVDVVTIGFGLRNVEDPQKAVAEFARVLAPGGRIAILEFSMPENRLLGRLYRLYFRYWMPLWATIISGDRTGAYRYLPSSVATFMNRGRIIAALEEQGLRGVRAVNLTCGVAVVYLADKPTVGSSDAAPDRERQ